MAKGTRKAKIAFTMFTLTIWASLTRSAYVVRKIRDCAIIARIATTIYAGIDLFLKDQSVAFALHFYYWLVLLWLLEQVDSCLGQ